MRCDEVKMMIELAADDGVELAPPAAAHISVCDSCRDHLDGSRRLIARLRADAAARSSGAADIADRALAALASHRIRQRSVRRWWAGAVAAAACLALALAIVARMRAVKTPTRPQQPVIARQEPRPEEPTTRPRGNGRMALAAATELISRHITAPDRRPIAAAVDDPMARHVRRLESDLVAVGAFLQRCVAVADLPSPD